MINWLEKVGIRDIAQNKERQFLLVAEPCVIENPEETEKIARAINDIAEELDIPFVFKASYSKANRTSVKSFNGVGTSEGLAVLHHIRETYKIPVLADVHSVEDVEQAKKVLDFIQIPAFLSRQTDLILAAARTNKIINIKKGQFLSPYDMKHAVEKILSVGNNKALITERGTFFGYGSLVNDFKSIPIMKHYAPVLFDATHSVQTPGSEGSRSGGSRQFIPDLSRAAMAAGAAGIYIEVHPEPSKALCDGDIVFPLDKLKLLIEEALAIYHLVNKFHRWEEPL